MMDIKRRASSRASTRSSAIAYGIEGSKVVLAALERTKKEDDIRFLEPVADNAAAILCTMQEIREGEIDDDFACLALDACGLAFILINECRRFRREHNQVPDRLKWGSNELADYLRDDVRPFVQKKISRGFLQRHLKHATDDEKIIRFREKLRSWMGKLGIQTDLSVHEKVEEIISEKVSTLNEEVQACIITSQEPRRSQEAIKVLQDSEPNSNKLRSVSDGSILPQIIVSDSRDDGGSKGRAGSILDSNYDKELASRAGDQDCLKKKKEEERLARKAERERWRRSEQEFSQLPMQETTGSRQPETPSRPASVASFCSVAYSLESVQSSVAQPTSILKHEDDTTDHELARRLQAQLAKEIEEEDEKKALEIGIALQRQWEAEERAKSSPRRLGLGPNPQLRTLDSMDSRSLCPETTNPLSGIQPNRHQNRPLAETKVSVPEAKRSSSPSLIHPTVFHSPGPKAK